MQCYGAAVDRATQREQRLTLTSRSTVGSSDRVRSAGRRRSGQRENRVGRGRERSELSRRLAEKVTLHCIHAELGQRRELFRPLHAHTNAERSDASGQRHEAEDPLNTE